MFVLGTRPEAVKLAPVILAAKKDPRFSARLVSTGQHEEMLSSFLSLFELRPDYDLKVMRPGQDLTSLTSRILGELSAPIQKEKPDWIVVQGDTMTCMAAALAGFLFKIPVAHVEAGLRTFDLHAPWPEEFNRRVAAVTASAHFPPTDAAKANLLREHVEPKTIHVTGNTGIDAQLLTLDLLKKNREMRESIEKRFPMPSAGRRLVLVTVHRREAHGEPLKGILRAIRAIHDARPDVEIVLPVHKNPNVLNAVNEALGSLKGRVHLTEPLDYVSFLALMEKCTIILTDSGGVQEEAPTLKKPVLVLRETTERAEAVDAGCAKLVGFDEKKIVSEALRLLDDAAAREAMFAKGNPFGDGHATARILDVLARKVGGAA
jgi:UDP-N-acetylglucosamine 2-epimerase (non-hydrolysing)